MSMESIMRALVESAEELPDDDVGEERRYAALEIAVKALGTGLAAGFYIDAARQVEAYLKGEQTVDNVKHDLTTAN